MDYNDVLKLIDAGFTAEEIRSMMVTPTTATELEPENASAKSHEVPAPESPEAAPDQDAQTLEALKDTIDELSGTIKELQRDNARGAVEPKRETPEEKTLTIIGDFMRSM